MFKKLKKKIQGLKKKIVNKDLPLFNSDNQDFDAPFFTKTLPLSFSRISGHILGNDFGIPTTDASNISSNLAFDKY